ncbi:MAG: isoprenylcysteine carboxylmethyltransferase family protein [Alphaproteobacteria bacterium]
MTGGAWLLLYVTCQRLAELALARRNTRRLLARGGVERGAGHYPLMVAFHALWLAAMWIAGWNAELATAWVAPFAVVQILRLWMLASLGERWTTRIIIVDEPPVRRGPYRFMKHPNYAIVVGEIALVPLCLGAPWLALGVSIAHLGVLAIRIRAENAALAEYDAG